MNNGFSTIFSHINNVEILKDHDLSKLSTMRVKANANLLLVNDLDALVEVIKISNKNSLQYILLGWGANQLLKDLKENEFYLKLNFSFDKSYLDSVHEIYELPASVSLSVLSSHATRNGLKGWEVFTGIPASLGGAIFMNAGTNLGEIAPIVKKVKYVSSAGELKEIETTESDFSYRKNKFIKSGEVIYEVHLTHLGQDPEISKQIKNYLALRNNSQPLKESTCGCVFKNSKSNDLDITCRAGMFIDIMGLKGFSHNGVRVSQKHANFMENYGDASYEDVVELIEMVQKELKLQYGVDFETEVKI